MKLVFSSQAWEDYLYWRKKDKKILRRINAMIEESSRTPFAGTGKPEPLKHLLAGYWSRRITEEHRFVYKPAKDALLIVQMRYHY